MKKPDVVLLHLVAVLTDNGARCPNAVEVKTRGRKKTVGVLRNAEGKFEVWVAGEKLKTWDGPAGAADHFIALVGEKNAEKATERAALEGCWTTEVELFRGEKGPAHSPGRWTVSKTHLASSAHPRGAWCYATRFGIDETGIAKGGCDIGFGKSLEETMKKVEGWS